LLLEARLPERPEVGEGRLRELLRAPFDRQGSLPPGDPPESRHEVTRPRKPVRPEAQGPLRLRADRCHLAIRDRWEAGRHEVARTRKEPPERLLILLPGKGAGGVDEQPP